MNATNETGAQKTAAEVEGIVNDVLPLAAAAGPAGAAIGAGVTAAESVANAILAATAGHEAPLAIATGAASALATNAAPVIATLPPADQAKAAEGLSLLQTLLADLKGLFGF